MGVIYKLHPKVRDFILESKKTDPNLSCRGISSLISAKFQLELSKSRVNFVIKQAGLSMPVGRRRKVRKNLVEADGLGAIILKSADYLIGGKDVLVNLLQEQPGFQAADLQQKVEYQLYNSLFEFPGQAQFNNPYYGLWALIGKKLNDNELNVYLNEVKTASLVFPRIVDKLTPLLSEIRAIKFDLSNNSSFFLDGQAHTIWSRPQIPLDLSLSQSAAISYMKRCLQDNDPLILASAPGYDTPSKEFFDFLYCSERMENKVKAISTYCEKIKEPISLNFDDGKKLNYIFGLWPWQYGQNRKINVIGSFTHFYFEPQEKDYYIAEVEAELFQPVLNRSIMLRGCALKTGIDEKIKILILTNLPKEKAEINYLVDNYLAKWPNLEEGFQDFSKKIELFTYASILLHPQLESEISLENVQSDISLLLSNYLGILDRYSRFHFFPSQYAKRDLPAMKEIFYSIRGRIRVKKKYMKISFLPAAGFPHLKDLEYACRRLNEVQIQPFNNKKLWFDVAVA